MSKLKKRKLSKEEIHQMREEMRREFKKKMVSYVLAALGLIASLSWNDTLKAFFGQLFSNHKDTLLGNLIYSILVTLIAVVNSIYLSHLFKDDVEAKKKDKEEDAEGDAEGDAEEDKNE